MKFKAGLIIASLTIFVLAILASGFVSADWPAFRNDAAHSGFTDASAVPITNDTAWIFATGGDVFSSPAVFEEVVYAGSRDGFFYAINKTDGGLLWSYFVGDAIGSSPAVLNGKVFFGADDKKVYALNSTTGALIWSYETNKPVLSSPAVKGTALLIGSEDDKIYALNESTGELLWRKGIEEDVISSPAVSDGMVFVGSDSKKIRAFNESTGEEIWKFTTDDDIKSSPSVVDGVVYVGSNDGAIYALDEVTGVLIWNYLAGGAVESSPAVANGRVFVGSDNGIVYALNKSTGDLIWSYLTGGAVLSSPAVANDSLVIGSNDGFVYALNSSTGVLIWSYLTGGAVESSPALANNGVFVGSNDGKVYAFGVPGFGVNPNPLISVTYPLAAIYSVNVTELNYTVSDSDLDSCWYSIDSGVTNTTIACGINATGLSSFEGFNTWTVYANDTAGNENSSSVTFFKDSVFPLISFASPTEANNSFVSRNWVFVNVTINETNEANVTFSLYNSSHGLINSTTLPAGSRTINWTNLTDGVYFYNVTARDIANNANSTGTRKITLDNIAPNVSLISPASGLSYSGANLNLIHIFNVTDANPISQCSIIVNSGAISFVNSTAIVNGTNNITAVLNPGNYNTFVSCTDRAGNVGNSSAISFGIASSTTDGTGSSGSTGSGSSGSSGSSRGVTYGIAQTQPSPVDVDTGAEEPISLTGYAVKGAGLRTSIVWLWVIVLAVLVVLVFISVWIKMR